MTDKPPLIIYHANCPDGMTAAWIANKSLNGGCELVPAQYGDEPPDVIDRDVFVLDFSYQREIMQRMFDSARLLKVLDHHLTAAVNCKGLSFCWFDMEKSGARLTWEYFNLNICSPAMVEYVEDSDLWRFVLPQSREVRAFVQSFPFTIESWDDLMATPIEEASGIGAHILRYRTQQIETVLANAEIAEDLYLSLHVTPGVVLSTSVFISDACHLALERFPQAAIAMNIYRRAQREWVHDLRSRSGSDVDVGAMAKLQGGGGHKHAAGFTDEEPRT